MSQSINICGLFMYGIMRLWIIKSNCFSWAGSRGWRRCASQTDWKATLYDEGRSIEVVFGRGVNISGIVSSEGRSGISDESMTWRCCCTEGEELWRHFLLLWRLWRGNTLCWVGSNIANRSIGWDTCRKIPSSPHRPIVHFVASHLQLACMYD